MNKLISCCYYLVLFLVLASFTYTGARAGETTLASVLQQYNISTKIFSDLPTDLTSTREGKEIRFIRIQTKKNPLHSPYIAMEIVTPIDIAHARSIAQIRAQIMDNLYKPNPTPYKGEFTNETLCAEKFKPVKIVKPNKSFVVDIFWGRASKENTWGNCDAKKPAHWGALAFLYDDKSKKLLEINVFTDEKASSQKNIIKFLSDIVFK